MEVEGLEEQGRGWEGWAATFLDELSLGVELVVQAREGLEQGVPAHCPRIDLRRQQQPQESTFHSGQVS